MDESKRELHVRKAKKQHTIAEGETLGAIALKYYGSASEDNWKAIHNANRAVIGDDPGAIKVGIVLGIPER